MVKSKPAEKPAGVVSPFRCWRCDKQLAEAAGPGTAIKCMRCGAISRVPEK